MPSGGDNVLTIHTNDGIERFRIDSSGNVKVGSAATISPDGDVFFTGVCTATTLAGDGSGLTGVASTDNIRTNTNATFLQNINVSGITTVGSAVTISESGIEATGVGITCANINGNQLGGRRNFFINGAMQVHQRAADITASGTYGMDRWWLAHNGTTTMARDTTVPSGEGFDYSIKLSNISGGDAAIGQPIELTAAGKQGGLASGKKITFSFYAKCDSGTDGITVICNFRQGKYSSTNQVGFTNSGASVTLTTTWTRHIVTMTIPTCHSGSTMAAFELNGISGTSYFTGFQVEVGSQATPFEHRSVGEELALCQRYFYKVIGDSGDHTGIMGYFTQAAESRLGIHTPVSMRTAPTYAGSGNAQVDSNPDSVDFDLSANTNTIDVQTTTPFPDSFQLQCLHSGGSTAGGAGGGLRFRSAGAFISLSAEL